jgi:hypothetical protein
MTSRAERLLLAENREGIPFAVAVYLRYKCNPVGVEWAHNIVAQFRNYRAHFIFQRRDFVGRSVFEVNCDRHGRLTSKPQSTPSAVRFFLQLTLEAIATALMKHETFSGS